MSRKTTIAIANLRKLTNPNGKIEWTVGDISFRCSDCGSQQEWTNFWFADATEPAKAQATPAIWCCDACQATRDEIFANRNAGI